MSRRWKILLVAAPVLALGLLLVVAHYRAKAAVERFKAQLRAEGELLSVDELIPAPTAGMRNGAQDFLNAHSRLLNFDAKFQPTTMAMVQPGHAQIAWAQPELPTRETSNVWPQLRASVETNRAALAEIREALGQPVLQFSINYHLGFSISLPHLSPLKIAGQRLSWAAFLEMHDHHTDDAFANMQALVALPGQSRNEPFLLSQLVRYAILSIAANTTWQALQYPHWSDEQLAQLQAAWESLSPIPELEPSMAMERAIVLAEYDKCRESLDRFDALGGSGSSGSAFEDLADVGHKIMEDPALGFEALMDRFPRRWVWKWWNSYDDEIWFLREHRRQIRVGRRTVRGEPYAPIRDEIKADNTRTKEPPRQFLVARLLGNDFYRRQVEKAVTAETQRRIVVTAIALKRFERRHGKLPTELSTLVPEFLKAVPMDPMDGHPLRFRTTGEKAFLLYSVGLDGKDGGGDPKPLDRGAKNFAWTTCTDWVWPAPATAEELRDYHAKLEQERGKKK